MMRKSFEGRAMVTFGVCATVEASGLLKEAGWDFVEEHVQQFLEGEKSDAEWRGMERLKGAVLPVPAANSLVPPGMKITGPAADLGVLRKYMQRVMRRARMTGIGTLVFGSGAARRVPEGFDHEKARGQILDFLRMGVELAEREEMLLVAEHLNRGESNIMNSVVEAMGYVRAVGHPRFQCLVDCWHFMLEKEEVETLAEAMPFIRHVHISDVQDRRAPGQTRDAAGRRQDFTAFFKVLKVGGYDGRIAVESVWSPAMTVPGEAARVLAYVKAQWAQA